MSPLSDGAAFGSGTLVVVNRNCGLVVTNWHVVRDSTGQIVVTFPDGFRSGATVLRADRDWDLAALVVWRPNVAPVAISADAPRPGDPLTIAGYGSGDYRTASGRCTEYVAPGTNRPFEMVELSAGAATATRADRFSTAGANWRACCSVRLRAARRAATAAGSAGFSGRSWTTSAGPTRSGLPSIRRAMRPDKWPYRASLSVRLVQGRCKCPAISRLAARCRLDPCNSPPHRPRSRRPLATLSRQ